ncbi:MAG: secretin and TonB N-terminal domain-containing protein [Kiritimatiellales bacterium]|nr:secretin and TonB N-terminal domain-containing protein [Kiritimatiellales bacterium]
MQTKRNVVIGPEVTNDVVTIHLTDVQWDNALDVILKPYGYGYRVVGNAIVVGELTRLKALETVEPLQSRVYQLSYLDAGDVKDIIEAQLSPRGNMSIITARGQKGWKNLATSGMQNQGSGGSLDMREREGTDEQIRSKTVVVSDVPSVLDGVAETLENIDQMPKQVLVEARFIEVNEDLLRDIGVEMAGTLNIGKGSIGLTDQFFDATPNAFKPKSIGSATGVTGERTTAFPDSLSTFGQLTVNSGSWDLFISMIEEDEDTETLSSPKILTLNNQEAAIVVGTRYPIISSDTTSNTSSEPTVSEELEYYESIGIQLNVVPQICADDYINMIVRPSVTEIVGFAGNEGSYPIIKARDTETQILVANGETIVIGGLLEERETEGVFKVPFLGDIPLIGRLFRRDTKDTKTIDLLIFLSATIIDEDNYSTILKPEEEEVVEEVIIEEVGIEEVDIEEEQEPAPKTVEEIMDDLS